MSGITTGAKEENENDIGKDDIKEKFLTNDANDLSDMNVLKNG